MRQQTDLPACVIDVELPGDIIAHRGKQVRKSVAQSSAPSVPHMERARGVCAHKFDEHLLALAEVLQAVLGAFGIYIKERLLPAVLFKGKIDETGPGDLCFCNDAARILDVAQNNLGDPPWRLGLRFCQGKGERRRQIPVALLPRSFERDRRHFSELQFTPALCPAKRFKQNIGYGIFHAILF